MPGTRVVVHTRHGPVQGVIGRKPVHVLKPEERGAKIELRELWVDIGSPSRKETEQIVTIGDATPASVALYLATIVLPLAMAAHVFWAVRPRHRVRAWPLHVASALLVLQWCAALWNWDLLPFATWR